jgi:hypothetical protein
LGLVKEIELAELRHTSMDTKLGQLSALMASRSLFGVGCSFAIGGLVFGRHWVVDRVPVPATLRAALADLSLRAEVHAKRESLGNDTANILVNRSFLEGRPRRLVLHAA